MDAAAAWLLEMLDNGPVAAGDLVKRAKAAGISEKTLRRASKRLGVCTTKSGMKGGWYWSCSSKTAKTPEDPHVLGLGDFAQNGHVQTQEDSIIEVEL